METLYKIPFTLFFLTGNLASFVSNAQTTRTNARPTFPCDVIVPSSITITTDAPNDLTICGSTQWHFDIDYTDGDLYQWKIMDPAMGSIVAGNYSPNVEVLFNNPRGSDEDVQVIVAVTKCNEIKRDTLTMHVINVPEYTVTPGATTVCAGELVNFSISPTPGSGDLSWDFGDGITSPNATTTYAYPNGGSIAVYTPVATIVHPEGCPTTVVTQGGPVTVKPAPVAHISPDNLVGCGSFSNTLSATVTTGFGSTTNYQWYGPGSPPNCSSCDTWDITEYDNYYVVVENSNGCQGTSNTVQVVENCLPANCPGSMPQLIASDSSFIDCGIVKANIQYDHNGATNIISESWVFPEEAMYTDPITGTTASATATFEKAGVYPFNYIVAYDNGMCEGEVLFIQTVYVPYIGDMRYTATCGSGSMYDITLFDHSNIFPTEQGNIHHSYAYKAENQWYPITAGPGDLEATVQLPAGDYQLREIIYSEQTTGAPPCTTLVNLNLPDKPNADFDIDAAYIPACINDVVIHFNNQSTPATGLQYIWDFGDGSTNYQPNSEKVYGSVVTAGSFYNVTLTTTNGIGCIDSKQNTVEIKDNGYWDWLDDQKPALIIYPTPPNPVGTPLTLIYYNNIFMTPPTYTWYQGSTPITLAVGSPTLELTQPGWYWVMGSDAFGCLVPSNPVAVNFIQTPTTTH